jgi:hypothetical protein
VLGWWMFGSRRQQGTPSQISILVLFFLLYDNFIPSRSWFIAGRHMSSFLWTGAQYCVSFLLAFKPWALALNMHVLS